MFILPPRGAELDKNQPVILTGYGGYNASSSPTCSFVAAAWLQSGGTYAVTNLRGGGEFGDEWHKAGMLAKKQNVFDDFIGAAEYLISEGYTSPARLSIRGVSNGCLLVGAGIAQRPELFKAAVCAVPLLDMLRFQNFNVTKFWTSEYGSSDDADQLRDAGYASGPAARPQDDCVITSVNHLGIPGTAALRQTSGPLRRLTHLETGGRRHPSIKFSRVTARDETIR